VSPVAQLKADMKKVGDTMLKEWLDKAGPEGKALVDAFTQVSLSGSAHAQGCSTPCTTAPPPWRRCAWSACWAWCCCPSPAGSWHFHLPGTDAYAGYLMAASGFLALAHTLKRGEHIRVTLLLSALTGAALEKRLELWALGFASLLATAVCLLQLPAGLAVAHISTTSPPATTPRRCGFRRSAWPWAR
jgi:hypothetical protein